jgi:hypothetical protein
MEGLTPATRLKPKAIVLSNNPKNIHLAKIHRILTCMREKLNSLCSLILAT